MDTKNVIAPYVSNVMTSSVRVSQHVKYQEPETEAAK